MTSFKLVLLLVLSAFTAINRLLWLTQTLDYPFVETELSLRGDPLVPGLPDDIALSCLLRLPVSSHVAGKTVCKRWYQLFGNKERFFT
ncbi:putative F-box domain-containing protein [Helianthus annuus]|nr:putative F-box domain-containing protein [Helianthus annuus]